MASTLATVPHQLAILTPDRLGAFASSLLRPSTPAATGGPSPVGSSPVGSSPAAAHLAALEDAVALGVDLKLVALSAASSWLPFRNPRKQQLAAWVRELLGALAVGELGARPDDDDAARIAALAGLYRGLKATRADNALVRDVEIEAAVAVEVGLEAVSRGRRKGKAKAPAAGDDGPAPALYAAASLLPQLPVSSVRALSTETLIELAVDSVGPSTSPDTLRRLSDIVIASLRALSTDLLHSNHVRSACETLTFHLAELAPTTGPPDPPDKEISLFLDFVAPVTSVLADVLIAYPLPPATIQRSSQALLVLIWHWAPTIDQAGGFEALYEVGRTWWTLLDVLMSDVWSADERSTLLRELSRQTGGGEDKDAATLARTNAALIVAEQVIGCSSLEAMLPVLTGDIVPTCNRHLDDNTRLDVFESAHSVILAILSRPLRRAAKGRPSPAVETFVNGLIESYLAVLLRNADCRQLSDDQIQHAVRIIVRRAGDISSVSASAVLDILHARIEQPDQDHAQKQTSLGLFAAVLPAVPASLLPAYLASLEQLLRLRTTVKSPERAALVSLVWDGVSAGLGDEAKLVGVEWWLAFQARLEGSGADESGAVKAKL